MLRNGFGQTAQSEWSIPVAFQPVKASDGSGFLLGSPLLATQMTVQNSGSTATIQVSGIPGNVSSIALATSNGTSFTATGGIDPDAEFNIINAVLTQPIAAAGVIPRVITSTWTFLLAGTSLGTHVVRWKETAPGSGIFTKDNTLSGFRFAVNAGGGTVGVQFLREGSITAQTTLALSSVPNVYSGSFVGSPAVSCTLAFEKPLGSIATGDYARLTLTDGSTALLSQRQRLAAEGTPNLYRVENEAPDTYLPAVASVMPTTESSMPIVLPTEHVQETTPIGGTSYVYRLTYTNTIGSGAPPQATSLSNKRVLNFKKVTYNVQETE